MRLQLPILLSVIVLLALLTACKKTGSTENFTETVNPTIPDFTTQINAGVNGFITDENNVAVQGATVKAGSTTATTDQFGYFNISTAAFAKTAGFVEVTKPGYFSGFKTFVPIATKKTFIRLKLLPQQNIGSIDAATGGTASASNGIKIVLPANAVVVAAGNVAYTGIVQVSAQWLNPADQLETQLTMPGDLRGIDSIGYLKALVTYGMMAVELTGDAGQKLQIAAGKKATLTFPLPALLQATAPASIALWSFDESRGLWKQESFAVKLGNNYVGDVGHFSYWNCDVGLPLVNFSAQIIDSALHPLANVFVAISIANDATTRRLSFTDANGFVYGMVPANNTLTISVLTTCNNNIDFTNIVTTNSDINLGSIIVDLNQYAGTISGTVNNCNGAAVTDGYVMTSVAGTYSIAEITNGAFLVAATICPGSNMLAIAVDRATSQQSVAQYSTLITGANMLPTLTACNVAATESIVIRKDDAAFTNYALPQYLFNGNYNFLSSNTTINAIDLLNGNQQVTTFSFAGNAVAGSFPLTNNQFTINTSTYQFTTATAVVITSYGLVGQFITGRFSGNAADIISPTDVHFFEYTFNIKRDQ